MYETICSLEELCEDLLLESRGLLLQSRLLYTSKQLQPLKSVIKICFFLVSFPIILKFPTFCFFSFSFPANSGGFVVLYMVGTGRGITRQ